MSAKAIKKFAFIDALRGWAILAVILVHAGGCVPVLGPRLLPIVNNGARGVQLFYIVSALTLFMSFESRLKHESRPVLNFFIRRFFRIAPLFYLVLTYYCIVNRHDVNYWAPAGMHFTHFLSAYTFTNGWFPSAFNMFPGGWSIAVESNFYLLLPLLFFFVRSFNRAILFTLATLFVAHELQNPILNFYLPFYQPQHQYVIHEFMGMYLISQVPIFSLGLILFFLLRDRLRDKSTPTPDQARQQYKTSLVLLAAGGSIILMLLRNELDFYFSSKFAYGLAFFCLIWGLALHPHRLLVNKFTIYVGKISYSAYLLHFLVLTSLGNPTAIKLTANMHLPRLNDPVRLAVVYICTLLYTLGISSLTFHLVELPTQKLGGKIINYMESARQRKSTADELVVAPVAISETN